MSKRLVELMHVPGLESITPQTASREPDFTRIEKVLVQEYELNGLNKKITSLKNEYQMPTQVGLFG